MGSSTRRGARLAITAGLAVSMIGTGPLPAAFAQEQAGSLVERQVTAGEPQGSTPQDAAVAAAPVEATAERAAAQDGGFAQDEAGNVEISTAEGFAKLAELVNAGTTFAGKTVRLTADIDLGNKPWTPVGTKDRAFEGVFDGGGHTVSNLNVKTGANFAGLFGNTKNGQLKNFTLHNARVVGKLCTGAVAGQPYTSKPSDIRLTGHVEVTGTGYVGGMFGKNLYVSANNLTVDVDTSSKVVCNSGRYRSYAGGVVGFMGEGNITLSNVRSNISVAASTGDVGGISGIAHYGNHFVNCAVEPGVRVELTEASPDLQGEIGGIAGTWLNSNPAGVTMQGCSFGGELHAVRNDGLNYTETIKGNSMAGAAYTAPGEVEAGKGGNLTIANGTSTTVVPGNAAQCVNVFKNIKDGQTIVLPGDISCDVVIPANVSVTLDLAGHTLTNSGGRTILVSKGAGLTVVDSVGGGVVDNVTHAKEALFADEGATVVLNGGTFKRSKEDANKNTFYTIINRGSMTINDGVTVELLKADGSLAGFSSIIDNGWFSGGPANKDYRAHLTINGGVINGGKYVKNDSYGVLKINGGTLKNGAANAVLNWNQMTVTGGTIEVSPQASGAILNAQAGEPEKGELTITGGSFASKPTQSLVSSAANTGKGTVEISGGHYVGAVPQAEHIVPGSGLDSNPDGSFGVHHHVFDGAWGSDETGHWHVCTTEGCTEHSEVEKHNAAADRVGVVAPTCSNEGYTGDEVCADCGFVLEKGKPVAATGHGTHGVMHHVGEKPTFDAAGMLEHWICGDCGALFLDKGCTVPVKAEDLVIPKLEEAKPATHTVVFDDGMSGTVTVEVVDGKLVSKPADPVCKGWEFVGWFATKTATGTLADPWDFNKPVTADMKLYAGWVKKDSAQTQPKPVEKPRPALPKTGDPAMMGMAAAAVAGAASIAAGRKKRKE